MLLLRFGVALNATERAASHRDLASSRRFARERSLWPGHYFAALFCFEEHVPSPGRVYFAVYFGGSFIWVRVGSIVVGPLLLL